MQAIQHGATGKRFAKMAQQRTIAKASDSCLIDGSKTSVVQLTIKFKRVIILLSGIYQLIGG